MRVVGFDVWQVAVPTIPGIVHSLEFGPAAWDQVPKFIIRLTSDEGIDGIGETYRGESCAAFDAVEKYRVS